MRHSFLLAIYTARSFNEKNYPTETNDLKRSARVYLWKLLRLPYIMIFSVNRKWKFKSF